MKKDKNSNIVRATLSELEKLGYRRVKIKKDAKGNILPPPAGSLLCLTSKTQDLWAELDRFNKVNPEQQLVLTK